MLKIIDPPDAQLFVKFFSCCWAGGPCGREDRECGQPVGNCLQLSIRLSTRPGGLGLVRRTRPQVHRLGSITGYRGRCAIGLEGVPDGTATALAVAGRCCKAYRQRRHAHYAVTEARPLSPAAPADAVIVALASQHRSVSSSGLTSRQEKNICWINIQLIVRRRAS